MTLLTAKYRLSIKEYNQLYEATRWALSFVIALLLHLIFFIFASRFLSDQATFEIAQGTTTIEVGLVESAPVESAPPVQQQEIVPAPIEEKSDFVKPLERPLRKKSVPQQRVAPPQAAAPIAPQNVRSDSGSQQTGIVRGAADYLSNPPPSYPFLSRKLKEEGTVLLTVALSSTGEVELVSVKRSSGFDRLDQAALKAVTQWKFKPAKMGGIAVHDTVEVPIRFELN